MQPIVPGVMLAASTAQYPWLQRSFENSSSIRSSRLRFSSTPHLFVGYAFSVPAIWQRKRGVAAGPCRTPGAMFRSRRHGCFACRRQGVVVDRRPHDHEPGVLGSNSASRTRENRGQRWRFLKAWLHLARPFRPSFLDDSAIDPPRMRQDTVDVTPDLPVRQDGGRQNSTETRR